jgi:NADH-quinone oxidoreductase subunit N
MIPVLKNMHIALPEMVVLITACIALLGDLFLRPRFRSIAFVCACSGLIVALAIAIAYLGYYKTVAFHGLYIGDDIANLMKIFIYIAVLLSFIYSYQYLQDKEISSGDYYVLGLFSTVGMTTLVSAHSLLTVYLGLELLSLPLYAMTAMRRTDGMAQEAAMKYFVMGAMASGLLLYGMALLYGATGKLDLLGIAHALTSNWQQHSQLFSFALVFLVSGIAFKLALVPFHMWAPDVYQGAPTSVTLFISGAPKIAAMGMAFRVFTLALPDLSMQWQPLLLVIALLSTGLGNILAIIQNNLKRLFAYSTISHMGYALFGLLCANIEGYAAALYYVLVYSLMSVGAFGLLVLMSRMGLEIEEMDSLKGLNRRNPWLAFLMMVVMLSMAGIPPTVGFVTKLLVLNALVDANMVWVAALGLFFAVIGAFYYLKVIKTMYFDEPTEAFPVAFKDAPYWIYSANCLALLYLGIFPGALFYACVSAFGG